MSLSPRRNTLCAAAVGVLLLANSPTPAAAATHVVLIDKMQYGLVPELKPGDVVEFQNKDMFRHSVTANSGRFNLDLAPGAAGRLRINSAGTSTFYCKYHPGMRATMRAR
jgi:plastocyanin